MVHAGIGRWLLGLIACVGALALSACDRPQPQRQATPALWLASDGDTRIWLFGTIHLLPPGVAWRTPAVRDAIAEADTLLTEIPPADPEDRAGTFLRMARAEDLPPIAERLPGVDPALLDRAVSAAGTDRAALSRMKSWAAALVIATGAGKDSGATVADGAEAVLTRAFARAGKRHEALETLAGQFAIFDSLPETAQRSLLAESVRAAASGRADYARTLDAWASGDPARIEAAFRPLLADSPALEQALLIDRNARWTAEIARRMKQPGAVLVAVGAGHLAGPDSVPAMLRRRGIRVVRVN
ncbi:TraB/GumN family protein [Stakelama saccharophila]|uniref:TraB/GumN family protein n=1 Tax=Stakelama saccharophila TaxID=3075605 RepID=A0ABZ0B7T0_9SPHN|nr:TraB/GumN family protein [Stakelama sp. W311]WNO53340.1 TraB/GumN family protein [Stakelama sp. W311]